MKQRAVNTIARYRVALPAQYMSLLERTQDCVLIRKTRYERYTLRGVPGRLVDVIVAEAALRHQDDRAVVLDVSDMRPHELPPALERVVFEVADKAGKYDGAIRRRYAVRVFSAHQINEIPWADLRVIASEPTDEEAAAGKGGDIMVVIRPRDGGAPIVDHFERLRSTLDGYNLERIIGWHARRWYTHLDYEIEVKPVAEAWSIEVRATGEAASWTLAEANRAAARRLYRLSRERGWRKLSLDEKERIHLPADSPIWRRVDELNQLYGVLLPGSPLGVGEATETAARTGHWPRQDDGQPLTDGELIQAEYDRLA